MDREPEKLELRYVPLSQAKLWDENPKRHDIDRLIRSIETHGFGDPPKYDARLEGLVYGNGRTEALERMSRQGSDPPHRAGERPARLRGSQGAARGGAEGRR